MYAQDVRSIRCQQDVRSIICQQDVRSIICQKDVRDNKYVNNVQQDVRSI